MVENVDYEPGEVAEEAAEIVSEKRDSHGNYYENHDQIAQLWTAWLGDKLNKPLTAWEVAIMMSQVKQSRMRKGRLIKDHFKDLGGYGDIAYGCAKVDGLTSENPE